MPTAAIATGCVDMIIQLQAMPETIAKLVGKRTRTADVAPYWCV